MADIQGKNVLITGGAGFIGSHLTDTLLAAGAEKVVIVDNFFLGKERNIAEARANYPGRVTVYRDDARDLGTMKAVMKKEDVEVVFNLATIALNYISALQLSPRNSLRSAAFTSTSAPSMVSWATRLAMLVRLSRMVSCSTQLVTLQPAAMET